MERLTFEYKGNVEMICRYEDCDICEEDCPISSMLQKDCLCLKDVIEKLAAYEVAEEQKLLSSVLIVESLPSLYSLQGFEEEAIINVIKAMRGKTE